ncbi:PPM-type phosphatase-like domain [Dillenia turbinata]|uniref:PPM-type phosphatase-like domain n=1 Tax=Dillenia turbinata TaxID=194707 RepID=A0AAN8VZV7_9MAGN
MGACCSKDERFGGFKNEEYMGRERANWEEAGLITGDGKNGPPLKLQGSSKFTSSFTQQGRKGVNQDAMTVWEDFTGQHETFFCGVFDGHGPAGHKVAHHVRDVLPWKISAAFKSSQLHSTDNGGNVEDVKDDHDPFVSLWKPIFIKSFKEMDYGLHRDSSIDASCSGTTAVAVLKKNDDLLIANLGDSRAVLGTRGHKNQLVSVQLTVDLKPNLPGEADRIRNLRGRVFALDEEPNVFRVWLPDENFPGLAMARAFGDFCLKEYGIISIPELSRVKLTDKDEFVVLATDGVWDVLSNKEVVKIVASARIRSMAAKLLVDCAVRAWRSKHPTAKVDDCAVVCLFFKPPMLTRSFSGTLRRTVSDPTFLQPRQSRTIRSTGGSMSANVPSSPREGWNPVEGMSRMSSSFKIPRFGNTSASNRRRRSTDVIEEESHCGTLANFPLNKKQD